MFRIYIYIYIFGENQKETIWMNMAPYFNKHSIFSGWLHPPKRDQPRLCQYPPPHPQRRPYAYEKRGLGGLASWMGFLCELVPKWASYWCGKLDF